MLDFTDHNFSDLMDQFPDKPFLKVDELQDLLRIGQRQAYQLVHREDFPSVRFNRTIRIPVNPLIVWLEDQME